MAAALRSSIGSLLATQRFASKRLLPAISMQIQRSIQSKAIRDLDGIKRPPPFDYKRKDYNYLNAWYDKTTARFDDNTKVGTQFISAYEYTFLCLYVVFSLHAVRLLSSRVQLHRAKQNLANNWPTIWTCCSYRA